MVGELVWRCFSVKQVTLSENFVGSIFPSFDVHDFALHNLCASVCVCFFVCESFLSLLIRSDDRCYNNGTFCQSGIFHHTQVVAVHAVLLSFQKRCE